MTTNHVLSMWTSVGGRRIGTWGGRGMSLLSLAKVLSFLRDDRSRSSGTSIRVYDYESFR